jgi:hypothetical protein
MAKNASWARRNRRTKAEEDSARKRDQAGLTIGTPEGRYYVSEEDAGALVRDLGGAPRRDSGALPKTMYWMEGRTAIRPLDVALLGEEISASNWRACAPVP